MQTKVKITGDDANNVIVPAQNNPEFGHIRVEQTRMVFDDKGWTRKVTISALIHGTVKDLKEMDFKIGDTLPGKVIVKESLKPFNTKNPERDEKIAGDTGIVCEFDGDPIYRKTFYIPNESAEDELIQHTNVDRIREAYAAQKAEKSIASRVEAEKEANFNDL